MRAEVWQGLKCKARDARSFLPAGRGKALSIARSTRQQGCLFFEGRPMHSATPSAIHTSRSLTSNTAALS
nr:hypothetical protein [Rhizobium fabae]